MSLPKPYGPADPVKSDGLNPTAILAKQTANTFGSFSERMADHQAVTYFLVAWNVVLTLAFVIMWIRVRKKS